MITLHTCQNPICPNEGITYRVEDATEIVRCGGCGDNVPGVAEDE